MKATGNARMRALYDGEGGGDGVVRRDVREGVTGDARVQDAVNRQRRGRVARVRGRGKRGVRALEDSGRLGRGEFTPDQIKEAWKES